MNKVTMSKQDFIKEHRALVKILNNGSKSAQKKEAREQSKELKKYIGKTIYRP